MTEIDITRLDAPPLGAGGNLLARAGRALAPYRRRLIVAGALILGDAASLALAYAVILAFAGPPPGAAGSFINLTLLIGCLFAAGLYSRTGLAPFERMKRRAHGVMLALGLGLLLHALSDAIPDVLVVSAATAALTFVAGFYGEAWVRHGLIGAGFWGAPALIVGSGHAARKIYETLRTEPAFGLRPIGAAPARQREGCAAGGTLDIDPFADAPEAVVVTSADQVEAVRARFPCHVSPQPIVLLVEGAESLPTLWLRTRSLGQRYAVELDCGVRMQGRRWLKRAVDLVIAVPAGLLALPLVGALAVAVKLLDPGPAFYVQTRIGRNGRIIAVPKIRTMYVNAERRLHQHLDGDPAARLEWERCFKLSRDPRVLGALGNFMRRSSLDELPQLWSVVIGTMSLVGPRPFPYYHLRCFDEEFQTLRASVAPGLTGLWQVSTRSNGGLETQKAQDGFYIKNWSIWLDLYILLQTVPAVLSGRGAK